MKRRFSIQERTVKHTYKGTITAADIRKRFNIPEDGKLTFRVPRNDQPDDEWDVEEIHVSWEQTK
jgi:hypothetical protein